MEWAEKRHGQPIHELGVFAFDFDAIGMDIHDLRALQRIFIQIQISFSIFLELPTAAL